MPQLRYISAFMTFLFMIAACSVKKDNSQAIFDQFNHTLINSNQTVSRSTELRFAWLNDNLADPVTAFKASIWYPKAEIVRHYSKELIDQIEVMLKSLEKEENKNNPNKFFSSESKRKQLAMKLQNYIESVMAIDSQMNLAFVNYWRDTFSLNKNSADILSGGLSVSAAIAVLNNFINQVLDLENRMVQFCFNNAPGRSEYCEFYSVFAVLSSSCVNPGEKIEITAGVGKFCRSANPVISVNSKPINVGYDGVGHYFFKAKSAHGKYSVPVKISYTDQEGREQTAQKIVEYTVANIVPQENR